MLSELPQFAEVNRHRKHRPICVLAGEAPHAEHGLAPCYVRVWETPTVGGVPGAVDGRATGRNGHGGERRGRLTATTEGAAGERRGQGAPDWVGSRGGGRAVDRTEPQAPAGSLRALRCAVGRSGAAVRRRDVDVVLVVGGQVIAEARADARDPLSLAAPAGVFVLRCSGSAARSRRAQRRARRHG